MKQAPNYEGLLTTVLLLLLIPAMVLPGAIDLAEALVPLVIVLVIAAIAIRLVFFFTRRF